VRYTAVVNDDFEHYVDNTSFWHGWRTIHPPTHVRADRRRGEVRLDADIFRSLQRHAEKLTRPEDYINHSLYFEAKTFFTDCLLVEDKLEHATRLRARVPSWTMISLISPTSSRAAEARQSRRSVRINENEPGTKTRIFFNKTNDGKLLLRE